MAVKAKKETLGFQTEVKHLLHLMIHSLYSNKEIFLRELISNGSDAADRLRFEALSNDGLYEGNSDLNIRVDFDKPARTITITDTGIGMTRTEVQEHIGTIAKSGTKQFFEKLTGDQAKDSELIGQFGVGFYSAFIVADKVILTTRKAGETKAVRWESAGEGDFTLETVEKKQRGTEIVLHLKQGEDEFLDGYRLRSIAKKFSEHIALPIIMNKDIPAETDDEGKETAPARTEDETVNSASALWKKSREAISAEDYNDFYKQLGHDYQDPLDYVHSKVEGTNEYTLLLYIPAHAPFDLWDREAKHGVKLYIRKVFISDDAEQLMPRYLRFVRGVIDTDSLPLNVSREILQQSKQISSIKSGAIKKILGLLKSMSKDAEKYEKFWAEFGNVIKEGMIEDHKNKDSIAKLLRFSSTHNDQKKQTVPLTDYVARMKKDQEKIYYVTADSFSAAKNSPHLEVFRKKGIEVILMTDRVDEWLVSNLNEFDGKQLQSVAKGELDLAKLDSEEEKKDQQETTKDFESILKQMKEVLADKVSEVRVTHRLTDSPACLVTGDHDMSLNMERIMKESGQSMNMMGMGSKPIFEINPSHALVTSIKNEQDDARFADITNILFDQAILSEGGQLDDPATFVHKLNGLLEGLLK